MDTSPRQSKQQRGGDIGRAFMTVFQRVKRRVTFVPVTFDTLQDRMLDALIQAAVSRCIDFNITANRTAKRVEESFFLLSNLRGICEDLIYLTYLRSLEEDRAKELIGILVQKHVADGLAVQRRFFDANNPLQPVLGGDIASADGRKRECQDEFRRFWKSLGDRRRDGPTMQKMAEDVGLTSTYDFIYFSASNFVHFNPQVLLRTGWANSGEPVVFSARHMHGYYRSFCSFYGAVLFIGFEASFGSAYFRRSLDVEAGRLIELIGHVHRWPEIVTFEEMNKRPPLYLLTHALRQVVREQDETVPYGSILAEVKGLKRT